MYEYRISLQGNGQKDRTTLLFILHNVADEAAAMVAAQGIKNGLTPLTDANISKESVTNVFFTDGTRPADGADCYEEAAVACYINDPADAIKLHTVRIPAPIDTLFMADKETVDVANADLITYVNALATYAEVSDGEQIVTTQDNGIAEGYKRIKAKRFN